MMTPIVRAMPVASVLLAAWVAVPVVQAADVERVVVRNAHLRGRAAASEDVRVNLLIVGGKLVVVTKDELVIQPGDIAVDANAGFLLGQLAMGHRPSFIILDRDPREDFDVLLNTEAHVRFARTNYRRHLPRLPTPRRNRAVGRPTRRRRSPSRFGTTTAGSGTNSKPSPSRGYSSER